MELKEKQIQEQNSTARFVSCDLYQSLGGFCYDFHQSDPPGDRCTKRHHLIDYHY